MRLGWDRALAWRLRRHLLDPIGDESVAGVVRRLGAIQAQNADAAELAVRTRRKRSVAGEVARAVVEGTLIRTFAFRGATHLMTPEEGGAYLALRAASRMWERPSWRGFYGLEPADWPNLRQAVREALADGPMTREELGAAISALPRFRHLGFAFTTENWTLLKPFAWQGDMSFGPARDGRATFQRLDRNPRWAGLPPLDEAGIRAVEGYLNAYGPATADHLSYWIGQGLGVGRKRIGTWVATLGERLVTVDVGGKPAYILRDDLDELLGTSPAEVVRLLPAYDQWVLGPGTADIHIVPAQRRALVSRGANIAIRGGFVSGTWTRSGNRIIVDWFAEAGPTPREALSLEVLRLGAILDRPLELTLRSHGSS